MLKKCHDIVSVSDQSHTDCQCNVLGQLVQLPSVFPQVEENKSKATQQKVTMSITAKVWNSKLSFPQNT